MSDWLVLREERLHREATAAQARRRRRRRWIALGVLSGGALALIAVMVVRLGPGSAAGRTPRPRSAPVTTVVRRVSPARSGYAIDAAPVSERVELAFRKPVRSGLMFDLDTGQVLWERNPQRVLPIASLTKMMTALVVASHASAYAPVLITQAAVDFSGSGVGLLPLHKYVPLGALLYGLLLPSGNDAAIALAQHVAGTQTGFIALMNARARELGLRCTHFSTVSGIVDRGNTSCAVDLALLAHAVLRRPLLARIVGSASAVLPFPIKGGKLYLYNNNPLLRLHYPGADGVKTGYTAAAGSCLVATARRGQTRLGVVLLHSADPPDQAEALLNAGFAAKGAEPASRSVK